MAMSNSMTNLINKIERRLGTRPLNLPDHLSKDTWADVIIDEALTTFSRYLPHKFRITVESKNKKDGYYIIDDKYISSNIKILGVRDIAWDDLSNTTLPAGANQYYGYYDGWTNPYGLEELAMGQMFSDQISLFNHGLYLDFQPPNKITVKNSSNLDAVRGLGNFKVDLLIRHSANLNTIEPTKMELFESLAQADVANYLYQELKYFDGLETVYVNIDMKMQELEAQAQRRFDIIQELKEGYVSAANKNQPLMYVVN